MQPLLVFDLRMPFLMVSAGGGFDDPSQILIPGQPGLQVFLLLVAFVAVPWMLLPKPLILKKRHEALEAAKVRGASAVLCCCHSHLPSFRTVVEGYFLTHVMRVQYRARAAWS